MREEARRRAAEEGREDLEELFRSMAKRGRQANLSFFAFTATPKHKTLAVFGRDGAPIHLYTMRQAIEEGFILDVLHFGTSVFWLRRLAAWPDEQTAIEFWQVKRDGGRRGIVEVLPTET